MVEIIIVVSFLFLDPQAFCTLIFKAHKNLVAQLKSFPVLPEASHWNESWSLFCPIASSYLFYS